MIPAVDADHLRELRCQVRDFLAAELAQGSFTPMCDSWLEGHDPEFSRKLGERGLLGMTWPRAYGGHERSALERFVVTEELLAAGAPVAAHWVADRQTGPLLLTYGTEEQKRRYLPAIADGKLFVAIGMSEPDSGSDLASIRTQAQKVDGGWIVNGTKVWTSHAHRSHVLVALVRTSPAGTDRHAGLSQLLIPLDAEGVTVRPIEVMTGQAHFAEVVLRDVLVDDAQLVGEEGNGWQQVTSELAYERSGPERFLSVHPLFETMLAEADGSADTEIGGVVSQMWALHLLSEEVHRAIEAGTVDPAVPALVKDAGTRLEQEIIEVARRVINAITEPSEELSRLYRQASLAAPAFTLRGGTNEILRTIVAKALRPNRV